MAFPTVEFVLVYDEKTHFEGGAGHGSDDALLTANGEQACCLEQVRALRNEFPESFQELGAACGGVSDNRRGGDSAILMFGRIDQRALNFAGEGK